MNTSDFINSRFASTLKDVQIFFSSCLSMHLLPVLFALILIVVADRKSDARTPDTENQPVVTTQTTPVSSIRNYVLLNPGDMTQVVAIYKVSSVILKIIR